MVPVAAGLQHHHRANDRSGDQRGFHARILVPEPPKRSKKMAQRKVVSARRFVMLDRHMTLNTASKPIAFSSPPDGKVNASQVAEVIAKACAPEDFKGKK